MRGKDGADTKPFASIRITPAYAGKRQATLSAARQTRDHPRLCGEKMTEHFQNRFQIGSPPPMRGKVQKRVNQLIP